MTVTRTEDKIIVQHNGMTLTAPILPPEVQDVLAQLVLKVGGRATQDDRAEAKEE